MPPLPALAVLRTEVERVGGSGPGFGFPEDIQHQETSVERGRREGLGARRIRVLGRDNDDPSHVAVAHIGSERHANLRSGGCGRRRRTLRRGGAVGQSGLRGCRAGTQQQFQRKCDGGKQTLPWPRASRRRGPDAGTLTPNSKTGWELVGTCDETADERAGLECTF